MGYQKTAVGRKFSSNNLASKCGMKILLIQYDSSCSLDEHNKQLQ